MMTIGRKLHDFELHGTPAASCEIVLGSETDKMMMGCSGAIFMIDGSAPAPQPNTLHGAKINGVHTVVDQATPWLVTVRIRRKAGS